MNQLDPVHAWWREFALAQGEFELPIWFSLLAYFTFGLTGALAALRRGYDFIGVSVLALITAGGGGLLRDGLLISRGPTTLLTDERYILTVIASVFAALAFQRVVHRLGVAIAVIDAVGLGAFAVFGVQVSLEAGLGILASVLGGVVTTVGGGLMRDILVREEPLVFKPGQFYALVALGGSALYAVLLHLRFTTPYGAALVTIALTFTVRMLAIRYDWRTSALQRQPPG